MGSSNNNRWNICVLLLEIELIASNSFPPFMWIFSPDHMADCLVVLVFLSMFCCNSFDKLYKLIRLCNRQARLCCFWQIMNNMCFWRVALIALVLNVVMKMMPNCVWHAVFELRTVPLIFLCGYECRDYMVGFYACCGWCHIEDSKGPAAEEATDLFPESREDELNKGLCGQTLLMYLH